MNRDARNGREELSMDWMKRQLKMISTVEPPPSLKTKLEAGIPVVGGEPIMRGIRSWLPGVRWAGAAAAVLVVASAVAWLGTPWDRHIRFAADTNSNPGRTYAADHNGIRPSDTNLCDSNGLR